MCVFSFNVLLYYTSVMGWVLFYLYSSFFPTLPWETCGNSWNTDKCKGMSTSTILCLVLHMFVFQIPQGLFPPVQCDALSGAPQNNWIYAKAKFDGMYPSFITDDQKHKEAEMSMTACVRSYKRCPLLSSAVFVSFRDRRSFGQCQCQYWHFR